MSYAHVDVEEVQTTKSEKLLAVVFAGFLLVGGFWAYQKLDDTVAEALARSSFELSEAEQASIERLAGAEERQAQASRANERARVRLEDKREAYNTALHADESSGVLRTQYRLARERYAETQATLDSARAAVSAARPEARAALEHRAELERARFDRHELAAFFVRLAFVVGALAAAYLALTTLRKRRSRALPLALGSVGAAAVLALSMGADYVTDYVDPLAFGPLLLSAVGVILTLLAFVALQRYLARRIPIRRVRRRECPFCGYPVREGTHCPGCGRAVVAECATCDQPRRVGTAFCGACGNPECVQRPRKSGSRFSRKAETPSAKSSLRVAAV